MSQVMSLTTEASQDNKRTSGAEQRREGDNQTATGAVPSGSNSADSEEKGGLTENSNPTICDHHSRVPVTVKDSVFPLAESKDGQRSLAKPAEEKETANCQLTARSLKERSPSPPVRREDTFGNSSASRRKADTEPEDKMNRVAAVVTLQVDKKHSKPEEYPAWRLRVLTGLNVSNIAQLVLDKEPFNDDWSSSVNDCWNSRYRKSNGLLVSAISDETLIRYQGVVNLADPVELWRVLAEDSGQGRGVTTVLIWERIYGRMFRPDEPVRDYIADLLKMQRELAENNDPISDSRLAKVMLTKAHAVYPTIADEVTEKLRRDPDYKYTVRDARGRLENAKNTTQPASA